MESGKDIGKFKKYGYFTGTKANRIRYLFGAGLAAFTIGSFYFCVFVYSPTKDSYVHRYVKRKELEQEQLEKEKAQMQLRRIERAAEYANNYRR